MKRALLIVIIVIVVVLIVAALIFFRSGTPGGTGTGSTGGGLPNITPTPSGTPAETPTGNTFVIGTHQGTVTVTNFYKSADYITQDQQTVVLEQTSTYSIVYNTQDSGFIISLLSEPLATARNAAEAAFLKDLGISRTDACKLTVNEGVPVSVSNQYPGVELGLSFCPGAINL